ncbi:GDSL-type esterase/lipase family protein [Lawsonibacter sp. LCP25S3_G6]|uniref:GDSL-type esterase/lipase family protein n=1 Tax=unclassified Lawsonibacter TaxID=2617946 RepID=UPI003F9AB929
MRKRTISLFIAGFLLVNLLSACGSSQPQTQTQEPPAAPTEEQTNLSDRTPAPQPPVQKQKPDAEPQSPDEAPAAPQPEQPEYDFSQPVPESEAVDNSYFEDAAFIGDSRTDGFLIYSGIGCGENLTSNGLSIFKLAEKKAITIDGNQYTLLEALALKQYGKVYLSLGINELGYYNDQGFYDSYCQAIDLIRESQPNAVIYIQGLIPLNEDVIAETGGASYLKNDHLQIYNDLMKKAAEEKQVAFLDLNPVFADENGQLPRDASADGVHLRKAYCQQWLDYLKTHTVSYDTLYPSQENSASSSAES